MTAADIKNAKRVVITRKPRKQKSDKNNIHRRLCIKNTGGFLLPNTNQPERRMTLNKEKSDYAFNKKIGKGMYQVQVHFNKNSKDTFVDKVFRLIRHDISKIGKK
jgi:hypothetical protein